MKRKELHSMLSAKKDAITLAVWLRSTYLPELAAKFNTPDVRRRLGLYEGERIPDNERNLTDVRNRVSLIVEYELARLSNDILREHGIEDLFWSYVVANRFPDLEVRNGKGQRKLRIEVKNLQSVAEEKSANFDTLRKDLNPHTDFIVVFVWEWAYDDGVSWDRAPRILESHVFHAYSLAELRDSYWLNRPPNTLGGGFQGFDLRFAVNCDSGEYSEEEGNYGKLLRIWQGDFAHRPPETAELLDTENAYLRFRRQVILTGFSSLSEFHLPRLSRLSGPNKPLQSGSHEIVGYHLGQFATVLKSGGDRSELLQALRCSGVAYVIEMTDQYICSGYDLSSLKPKKLFSNIKPKILARALFNLA